MKRGIILKGLLISTMLVGCSSGTVQTSNAEVSHEYHCRTIDYYDYSSPVPTTEEAVEDSYFADTFFGGDSRMGSLYLYSGLRDKGAEIWYCESLSLFRIYDMLNEDMNAQFGDSPLYTLLTTSGKKNIYIWLGINEIRSDNFDSWKETYGSIIDDIKSTDPTKNIYIMSCYRPRIISGLDEGQIATQVQMVNDAMLSLANEHHVYYYNTDDGMIDETGQIREDLVWDGLHMNYEGTNVFAEQLAKHVVKEETYVKKMCE